MPASKRPGTNSMIEYKTVLEFWFGEGATNMEVLEQMAPVWWKKDTGLDEEIRTRFEPALLMLVNGELDHWLETETGHLAQVILADQFSRNMYRDTADAFATDPLAVDLTLQGLESAIDLGLRLVERAFLYMPLMHAESLEYQEEAVLLFANLENQATSQEKKYFRNNLDFAIQHRDIIERFGRFPHRNRILGRESTLEELEFLQQPGSSF